jgi:hypothetical protein
MLVIVRSEAVQFGRSIDPQTAVSSRLSSWSSALST